MTTWRLPTRSPGWLGWLISVPACLLSVPPWRTLIEQSMLWHMAVQMPMLVAGGFLLARAALARWDADPWAAWNRYGLTGFFASQLLLVYWMLPLAVDRAIVLPQADALKLVSLLAGGALLADSFRRSPAELQLFFVGYAVSMLLSTGAYLATADRRLCNAYALDAQVAAGWGVAAVGLLLAGTWGFAFGADARRRAAGCTTGPATSRP